MLIAPDWVRCDPTDQDPPYVHILLTPLVERRKASPQQLSREPSTKSAVVGEYWAASHPAVRSPRGIPPRKASMKMLIIRPRISSSVVSWTSEVIEAKSPIRHRPVTKSRRQLTNRFLETANRQSKRTKKYLNEYFISIPIFPRSKS